MHVPNPFLLCRLAMCAIQAHFSAACNPEKAQPSLPLKFSDTDARVGPRNWCPLLGFLP
ncbi:hypothetical protein EJ06DRAFT_534141 [Trichodelitschia bisporula]|uniref:Uncharacterized protein n=1 Tax=Trichodelitschia bisporula TaxID=703511 RepID=A0A6G1HK86_9PEZI|nr:hypothetical protein EJ06DRAFT_534141 [Trichodelitschia bisporula]